MDQSPTQEKPVSQHPCVFDVSRICPALLSDRAAASVTEASQEPPPKPLMDSLVHLTAAHDYHVLSTRLKDALGSLPAVADVQLFEVLDSGGAYSSHLEHMEATSIREVGAKTGQTRRVTSDPSVVESLRQRIPVRCAAHGPGSRILVPVMGIKGPTQLIAVHTSSDHHLDEPALHLLVSAYQNLMLMLDSRDRDPLTGLFNRRVFDTRLLRVLERQGRFTRRLSDQRRWLAVLDIDFFKRVNDTYGHLYGDEILLLFAQIMQRTFRQGDQLFRYGGEEFVVILDHTSPHGVYTALERFRRAVESYDFPTVGRVTVSIGYSEIGKGMLPSSVFDQADRALYHAKENGRNQVVAFLDVPNLQEEVDAESTIELF